MSDWFSAAAGAGGGLLAVLVQWFLGRSDSAQKRLDDRTDERIKLWAANTDPAPPFLRADVYKREQDATNETLKTLKTEFHELREYVQSEQLPRAIADEIGRRNATPRMPVVDRDHHR